jgi:hypothetical protein
VAGAAGAEVVATEFFFEFLITVDDLMSFFHARFGWESFASFAGAFECWFVCVLIVMCHTASCLLVAVAGESAMGKGRYGVTPFGGCSTIELRRRKSRRSDLNQ